VCSVGAYPERIAAVLTSESAAPRAPPRTWEILRELEKMPAGKLVRLRLRIPTQSSAALQLFCYHRNVNRPDFESIRVADFTPASTAVKGVIASSWERLSM
jgi:hypothetical protein